MDNKFSRSDVEKTKKREKSTRAARVDYTEPQATRIDPDISEKKIERPKRTKNPIDRLKPSSR